MGKTKSKTSLEVEVSGFNAETGARVSGTLPADAEVTVLGVGPGGYAVEFELDGKKVRGKVPTAALPSLQPCPPFPGGKREMSSFPPPRPAEPEVPETTNRGGKK